MMYRYACLGLVKFHLQPKAILRDLLSDVRSSVVEIGSVGLKDGNSQVKAFSNFETFVQIYVSIF